MSNEEIQKAVLRAEAEYEMLKDRVHDQYDEIQRLKKILKKAVDSLAEMVEYADDGMISKEDTDYKYFFEAIDNANKIIEETEAELKENKQ